MKKIQTKDLGRLEKLLEKRTIKINPPISLSPIYKSSKKKGYFLINQLRGYFTDF